MYSFPHSYISLPTYMVLIQSFFYGFFTIQYAGFLLLPVLMGVLFPRRWSTILIILVGILGSIGLSFIFRRWQLEYYIFFIGCLAFASYALATFVISTITWQIPRLFSIQAIMHRLSWKLQLTAGIAIHIAVFCFVALIQEGYLYWQVTRFQDSMSIDALQIVGYGLACVIPLLIVYSFYLLAKGLPEKLPKQHVKDYFIAFFAIDVLLGLFALAKVW